MIALDYRQIIFQYKFMNEKVYFKIRLYSILIITVAIWSLLAWDYFHGGVPSHHLLARKDLPSISNWWGGLLVPIVSWFLLHRIQKRISINRESSSQPLTAHIAVLYGFIGALLFAAVLSIFFTTGNTVVPSYMLRGLLLTALFLPIYRAECFLGFIIGMTYTFGGVLPVLVGSVLVALSAILYLLIRPAIQFVSIKIVNLFIKSKNL
jgi:hypothetical protein